MAAEGWTVPAATAVGEARSAATTSPRGLARLWVDAIVAPRVALLSAVLLTYAAIELLALLLGHREEVSRLTAYLMAYAPPVLILALPKTTGLWRIHSMVVGVVVGPVLYSGLAGVSVRAYNDSWVRVFDDGGLGLVACWLTAFATAPLLEALGAWLRRDRLADEAARRRSR